MRISSAGGRGLWPWPPLPRWRGEELLDGRSWEIAELQANLRDIRRVNRLGGGTSAVLRELPDLLSSVPEDRQIEVLDLATGSADIPLAVVRWAKEHGRSIRVVASDTSDDILAVAEERTREVASILLANYDARAVPLPDRSVDVVLCSLALHHFEPVEAMAVLAEMARLARCGFIVNDLVRGRAGYAAAVVTSRLLTRNRLTRHDAPLSVRRAFTPDELRDLIRQAGIEGVTVRRRPLFRMVAVWKRRQ
jgi:ubiquinone/menaquinone biosynthesis C-methylase UbiE